MKLELTSDELYELITAAADGERLYRRLRRDVEQGLVDHYDVAECTQKMKDYRNLHSRLTDKYEKEFN